MNRFDRERFDAMGKEALARVEEIMNTTKLNELIHQKGGRREEEKLHSLGISHYSAR